VAAQILGKSARKATANLCRRVKLRVISFDGDFATVCEFEKFRRIEATERKPHELDCTDAVRRRAFPRFGLNVSPKKVRLGMRLTRTMSCCRGFNSDDNHYHLISWSAKWSEKAARQVHALCKQAPVRVPF
jgi:hypothetical protein